MKDVWHYDTLCCPNCRGDIEISKSISCKQCSHKSKSDKDLRPTHAASKAFTLEYDPGLIRRKCLTIFLRKAQLLLIVVLRHRGIPVHL